MSQIKINQTVSSELISMQSGFNNLKITKITKGCMKDTNLKKAQKCIDEHIQISDVIQSLRLAGLADVKDAMNQIQDAGDLDEELAKAIRTKGSTHRYIADRHPVKTMKRNRT